MGCHAAQSGAGTPGGRRPPPPWLPSATGQAVVAGVVHGQRGADGVKLLPERLERLVKLTEQQLLWQRAVHLLFELEFVARA